MLEINKNYSLFKNGAFEAIKLFKTKYKNNNILLYQDQDLFINNIDRLLQVHINCEKEFKFGFYFILENLKNLRDNSPFSFLLYLSCLEILINYCNNAYDLLKFKDKFLKVSNFLLDYYKNSELCKVKLDSQDIQNSLSIKDSFLLDIINVVNYSNIEIYEDNCNKIVSDNYYRINCNLLYGKNIGENNLIYIGCELEEKFFINLINLNKNIVIICNKVNFDLKKYNTSKISIFKISRNLLLFNVHDIIKLSKSSNLFFDICESYKPGICKSYKFYGGALFFNFDNYFNENDSEIAQLKNQNYINRFFMMQGKNNVIYCQEEYLETVRNLVSLIRSFYFNGIFYSEVKTLKILIYYFNKDKDLQSFFHKLLELYLKNYDIEFSTINYIINSEDLKIDYDVINKNFSNKLFKPLDLYLNIFNLLASNCTTLGKVY